MTEREWRADPYIIGWLYSKKHFCGFKSKNKGEWMYHLMNCGVKRQWWQIMGYNKQ